ncbi:TPA: hypothetical protein N0F65_000360 (mitochondrion) [Lagenidium giganteum]|uniref:Uncharacterized protein n=1 Tax=Lagenidium giganteum TaxID=4803 RepID=A0AAV2YHB3_9STRA|nr:TPA: hypothetical protein N0F65_000360 [Lagenidium giganteum]
MSKSSSNVLKHLQEIDKLKFKKEIKEFQDNSILPIENFNIPNELLKWFTTGCIETLIINGLSGMGKTELIKSFLKSKNIKFLLIKNVQDLCEYNPQIHKAVIFDDIFFEKELSAEEHINIANTANSLNIKILSGSIRIMQNTLRIFTTNNVKQFLLNNYNKKAVLSKYFILNINKSLFKDDINRIKIRNKNREQEIYEHNLQVLKELGVNNN